MLAIGSEYFFLPVSTSERHTRKQKQCRRTRREIQPGRPRKGRPNQTVTHQAVNCRIALIPRRLPPYLHASVAHVCWGSSISPRKTPRKAMWVLLDTKTQIRRPRKWQAAPPHHPFDKERKSPPPRLEIRCPGNTGRISWCPHSPCVRLRKVEVRHKAVLARRPSYNKTGECDSHAWYSQGWTSAIFVVSLPR